MGRTRNSLGGSAATRLKRSIRKAKNAGVTGYGVGAATTASPATAKASLRRPYTRGGDRGLTAAQRKSGTFRGRKSIRVKSARTLAGFSTGMHEEVVPTDVLKMLDAAKPTKNGTHIITTNNRKSPFFKAGPIEVDDQVLAWVKAAGDGFRADTARTTLSVNGGAAGHSGSNLDTHGQSAAHDAIRETLISILKSKPSASVTQRSVNTAFGAIASLSSAPGELAGKVPKIASLKDRAALADWEYRRDAGKQKLDMATDSLSPAERAFVLDIAEEHRGRIAPPGLGTARKLAPGRARSPTRSLKMTGAVQGGGYQSGGLLAKGVEGLPANIGDYPMYFSAERRTRRG